MGIVLHDNLCAAHRYQIFIFKLDCFWVMVGFFVLCLVRFLFCVLRLLVSCRSGWLGARVLRPEPLPVVPPAVVSRGTVFSFCCGLLPYLAPSGARLVCSCRGLVGYRFCYHASRSSGRVTLQPTPIHSPDHHPYPLPQTRPCGCAQVARHSV